MEVHQNDDELTLKNAKQHYNSLIDLVKAVLGESAFFSGQRRKFNGAVYDSIMIPFSLFPKKSIMKHADEIRTAIEKLKSENTDYQNWVYVGTNAGNRFHARIDAVMSILNSIIRNSGSTTTQKRYFSPDIKQKLFHPGYICKYCGNQILSIDDCEVDHIIPFDQGGPTEIENAQLLHKSCNRSKGNRLEVDPDIEDDTQDENEND